MKMSKVIELTWGTNPKVIHVGSRRKSFEIIKDLGN
jgi:hypothetical protein